MNIELKQFSQVMAPPPVVLVSTLFGRIRNVAPFGMVMPVSYSPPLLALGIGETRDTLKNIQDTHEFVVCVANPGLVDKIILTARFYPRNVSEFDMAGFTPLESSVVKPCGIKECQSNLECKVEWVKKAGDHQVVVGRIVAARIGDEIYQEGKPLATASRPGVSSRHNENLRRHRANHQAIATGRCRGVRPEKLLDKSCAAG